MTKESIFVQIDDERIELTGEAKQAYLAQKELDKLEELQIAEKLKARQEAKAALLERLGITEAEAKLLLA